MESIGFKEWAVVCEALGRGRQTVIVRKGGIAEGRGGFSFKHAEFFLFPTWFHEQPARVREVGFPLPEQDERTVEIRYAARVEHSYTIHCWEMAEALMPFHILRPEVVRERFEYNGGQGFRRHLNPVPARGEEEAGRREPADGLHVAFVRVYKVSPTWSFPNENIYCGCRSWIRLPPRPNDLRLLPVLSRAEHEQRCAEFSAITRTVASTPGTRC